MNSMKETCNLELAYSTKTIIIYYVESNEYMYCGNSFIAFAFFALLLSLFSKNKKKTSYNDLSMLKANRKQKLQ